MNKTLYLVVVVTFLSLPVSAQILINRNDADAVQWQNNTVTVCSVSESAPTSPIGLLKWRWEQIAEARRSNEGIMRSEIASRLPQEAGMRQAADRIAAEAAQMAAIESALAKLEKK